MKYTIRHGSEIDVPTVAEIITATQARHDQTTDRRYYRHKDSIQLGATGAGQGGPPRISGQYDWRIERVTVVTNPAAAALVLFYENQAQPGDLLEVIQLGTAGLYSDAFSNDLYVPANSQILVVVTNGAANGQCAYNLQIHMVKHI